MYTMSVCGEKVEFLVDYGATLCYTLTLKFQPTLEGTPTLSLQQAMFKEIISPFPCPELTDRAKS